MNPKRSSASNASIEIGIIFLVLGSIALIFSIIQEVQILAFIGLGLAFWGGLFLIIAPKRFVEVSFLDSAVLPNYRTADRIIRNLDKPVAYHTPPYPRNVLLPEHLKGLTDMVVFITNESEKSAPDIQELSEGKFIMRNPPGIVISPPGIGILTTIENRTNTDFAKMNLEELCETLPRLLLENLPIADEIEMITHDPNIIKLKLTNSVYKNLYRPENNLRSISILGCPIVSAAACAIAKTTGKAVTIQQQETSPHGLKLNAVLKIKLEPEKNAVPVDVL